MSSQTLSLNQKIDAFDYAAESGDLPDIPFDEIVRLADDVDADPDTASRKLRSLGVDTDDPRGLMYSTYFDETTRRGVAYAMQEHEQDYFSRTEQSVKAMAEYLGIEPDTVSRARELRAAGDSAPYDLMKAEFYSR